MKKSPSSQLSSSTNNSTTTTMTASTTNSNSSSGQNQKNLNGVGKMEKNFEFLDFFKKCFKTTPSGNRVGNQIWPVLTILRMGGNLPLVITVEKKEKESFAASSLWSVYALPTITIGSFFVLWWSRIIYNLGFDASYPLLKPPTGSPFTRVNAILQPIIQISEIVTGWFTCRLLATYMNNWESFENQFNSIFKDVYKYKMNIKKFRDSLFIFYVFLPALFFIQHQNLVWITPDNESNFGAVIFSTLATFTLVVFSLMDDVKILLMYRIAQENFRETKNGIIAQYKMTTSVSKIPLGPEKVKQWIQLVQFIRNQHNLACQIQTPHQVISIALSVLVLSNNLFLFVNSLINYTNDKTSISFLPLGAFALVVMRLVFKCYMAEKVTDEEQSIAQDLITMEASGGNIFIKMELKFLYDLVVSRPVTTSFANLFTLSRAFLLQVLGQVISLLIIAMQFNLSIMMDSPVMY